MSGPLQAGARWYPTQITLPDGRTALFSGIHNGALDPDVEIYSPEDGEWTSGGSIPNLPYYARGHVMPDGRVFFGSPTTWTRWWNPEDGQVTAGPARPVATSRTGGSSILIDATAGKILVAGGGVMPYTTATAEIFNAQTGKWTVAPSMEYRRVHQNAVLLPTGEVFVAGGDTDPDGSPPIPAEMYDPQTGTWRRLATPAHQYVYHSNSLLLMDGTILTTNQLRRAAELYRPWYAHLDDRPTILSAPAAAGYGQTVTLRTEAAHGVDRVVMVRLSSTTHGLNTDQRLVPLAYSAESSESVTLPASAAVAPPGYYMLFVVDARGVPSVARTVRLGEGAPAAPGGLVASSGPGRGEISLMWTPPAGAPVADYVIHRRPSTGGPWTLAGTSTVTAFVAGDLPDATSFVFTVAARNEWGDGPPSAEKSAFTLARPLALKSPAASTGAETAEIALSWILPTQNSGTLIQEIRVYRSPGAWAEKNSALVATLPGGATSFVDTGLLPGQAYSYRLATWNPVGESPRTTAVGAPAGS